MAATEAQLAAMPPADYERRLRAAYDILVDSGAHYVIDSVADLIPVVDDIERRLADGQRP
jgi:phosphonoacetaldehyde hydrolase